VRQDKPHGDHRTRYASDRQRLTAAGFTDSQAEALTQALRQVQQIDLSDLTTKADLAELRNEIKLEFAAVRREMAEAKTELID
jgi:hypothetical protein